MYFPFIAFMSVLIVFICVIIGCILSVQLYSKLPVGETVSVFCYLALSKVAGTQWLLNNEPLSEWMNELVQNDDQNAWACIEGEKYTPIRSGRESHWHIFSNT